MLKIKGLHKIIKFEMDYKRGVWKGILCNEISNANKRININMTRDV